MDRFTGLTVFVKAVDLGSFSAAAEALQMSSQLVGRHIKELEQRLGVRLLNRTTRRQSLTGFGHTFYERACIILAEIEAAEGLAAETRAIPTGRLRISAPVSFGVHILAAQLPAYMTQYPQVQVDLKLSNRLVDLTEEGFDAVFRIGELEDSRFVAKRLAPYELVLCAAPSYLNEKPVIMHPMDLVNHECLVYAHTALRTHWSFTGHDGLIEVPVSSRLIVDHGEPLLRAALAGMGVLLQPLELVGPALANGQLVQLLPDFSVPARPTHILYAADRQITPKLRSFIDFSVNRFA